MTHLAIVGARVPERAHLRLFNHLGAVVEEIEGLTAWDDAAAVSAQCPVPPGAIAVLVSGNQHSPLHPECVAFQPVPVFRISAAVAAARALPETWSKFQLIDPDSRTLWLLEKRNRELISATCVSWDQLHGGLGDALGHYAAIGFAQIAAIGLFPGACQLSPDVLMEAARQCLTGRHHAEGTHLTHDPATGGEVLRLVTTRKIAYDVVHVQRPVFSLQESALADMADDRPVLIVVDQIVDRIYGEALDQYSSRMLNCAGKLVLEAVEGRKNAAAAARICKYAAELGFPRHGIFVAVGGGITLDVVGLAASLFRRGVGYLRVPTTLVGLIDAGLGVKQGVNFAGKKNLVGAFYPPVGVINDVGFLNSLPLGEISCGLAEIAKIALVRDRELFETLELHGRQLYQSRFTTPAPVAKRVILRSAMLMLEELQPNLFENNLRRLVDFGHTFSPVIEMHSGYEVPHGFAVALDMLCSTAIAINRGLCPARVLQRLIALFQNVHLPCSTPPCSMEQLMQALWSARQHRGGHLNLVIPTAVGEASFLQDVSRADMEQALELIDAVPILAVREKHAGAGL